MPRPSHLSKMQDFETALKYYPVQRPHIGIQRQGSELLQLLWAKKEPGGFPDYAMTVGVRLPFVQPWNDLHNLTLKCRNLALRTGLRPKTPIISGLGAGSHLIPLKEAANVIGPLGALVKECLLGVSDYKPGDPNSRHLTTHELLYRQQIFMISWGLGVMLGQTEIDDAFCMDSNDLNFARPVYGNLLIGVSPLLELKDEGFLLRLGSKSNYSAISLTLQFPVDRSVIPDIEELKHRAKQGKKRD